jgi:hypothetical protein
LKDFRPQRSVHLEQVISALFDAVGPASAVGFMVAASALLARTDVARWLAWFVGLVGALSFVDYPLLFAGTETGDIYGIV